MDPRVVDWNEPTTSPGVEKMRRSVDLMASGGISMVGRRHGMSASFPFSWPSYTIGTDFGRGDSVSVWTCFPVKTPTPKRRPFLWRPIVRTK